LFQSPTRKNLQVQIGTNACTFNVQGKVSNCIHQISFAMGNSIARFFSQQGALVFTKGTKTLQDFRVLQSEDSDSIFRVFLSSDPSTFFEVILYSQGYLSINAVVSAYFKKQAENSGLLGNYDGDASNDDTEESEKFKIVDPTKDLFTCSNRCADLLPPQQAEEEADKIKMTPIQNLQSGFRNIVRSSDCPKGTVSVENNDWSLVEGDVKQLKIAFPKTSRTDQTPVVRVQLVPEGGVSLRQKNFFFDVNTPEEEYTTLARFDVGGAPANLEARGSEIKVNVQWIYPYSPQCGKQIETLTFKVEKKASAKSSFYSNIFPSTTLDGAKHGFSADGVFNFFQSKNLLTQIRMKTNCVRFLSCVNGFSFAMGTSVTRFTIEGKKLVWNNVTETSYDFQVKQKDDTTYVVSLTSDPSTYFYMLKDGLYDFLTIRAIVSPYFQKREGKESTGLLGNYDGDASNDDTDTNSLIQKFKIEDLTQNLFTCSNGCANLLQPLEEADKIRMTPVQIE
jgi:hypothetical protein